MSPEAERALKERHERRLLALLWSLWAKVADRIERELRGSGSLIVADVRVVALDALAQLLVAHYAAVARDFAGDLVDSMPPDVAMSEAERLALRVELSRVFRARAGDQAAVILATAQRRLLVAARHARQAAAADGAGSAGVDLPSVVARTWLTRQRIASTTIAVFETQSSAETAKGVAAMTLIGQSTRGVKAVVGEPLKVWLTQSDSRVRAGEAGFDHLDADGQRVPVSEPFVVSGERLRWPGDWSLGASGGNIYGCRCSAVYEVDSLAELRGLLMEAIRRDTEVFAQTESAVVVSLPFAL
jgi:hypothetical protein